MRLSEYFVHDVSLPMVATRGGIPIPNSVTLTPIFLAAVMWPRSWMTTRATKASIISSIPSIRDGGLYKVL